MSSSGGLVLGEVIRLVNRYIGVSGGYLGDFSYRTLADFYPEYCGLDLNPFVVLPDGTTRERYIAVLKSRPLAIRRQSSEGLSRGALSVQRVAMVVDLPVPTGPTSTSRTRPEVAIFSTARAWSVVMVLSRPGRFASQTRATVPTLTVGEPVAWPRWSSRCSASRRASVV